MKQPRSPGAVSFAIIFTKLVIQVSLVFAGCASALMNKANRVRGERKIFITGATGMVGSQIARDLLDTDPTIRLGCLVRASSPEEAAWRLEQAMNHVGAGYDPMRVEAIPGDITVDSLGMDEANLASWANCEAVIHCAADIKNIKQPGETMPNSIQSIKNIIDFATAQGSPSSLHFLSSAATCLGSRKPVVFEKDHLQHNDRLPGGYAKAKYDAEAFIAKETQRLGLHSFVYRAPFIISCHHLQPMTVPDILFKLGWLTGVLPRAASFIPFCTLERVSRAVTQCVLYGSDVEGDEVSGIEPHFLHLADAEPASWEKQLGLIRTALPFIQDVEFEDFRRRVKAISGLHPYARLLGSAHVLDLLELFCSSEFPQMDTRYTQQLLAKCHFGDSASYNVRADDFAAVARSARTSLLDHNMDAATVMKIQKRSSELQLPVSVEDRKLALAQ